MARWADFPTCAVSGAAVTLRGLPASNGSGDLLLTQVPICQRAPSGVPRGLTLRTPHWVPVAPENRERKEEDISTSALTLFTSSFYILCFDDSQFNHTRRGVSCFSSLNTIIFSPTLNITLLFWREREKHDGLPPPGLRNARAELGRRSLDSVVYAAQ